jgi:16S rRNA (adenine1518-N6/adenine1519-N6)-dimethyltransferase
VSAPYRDSGRPKRSLGQNFLVDPNIRRKILDHVRPRPTDTVVEIGPGRGALTEGLIERSPRLVVIELDSDLARIWEERAGSAANLEVITGNVLDVRIADLADPESVVVVGNIPYNITTPILFHLLDRPRPREIILMVQKEVSDRLAAAPGSSDYGALSVGVQLVADVVPLFNVPRSVFRPRPAVDSTVVRIVPKRPAPLTEVEERSVRAVTRAAFQWRRKQIGTTLRKHPDLALGAGGSKEVLKATGLDGTRRPETLSVEVMVSLARAASAIGWDAAVADQERRAPPR